MEHDGQCLAWFRIGTGVVMIGHSNVDVHQIVSPADAGIHNVSMLVEQWVDGSQRFDRPGEALLLVVDSRTPSSVSAA